MSAGLVTTKYSEAFSKAIEKKQSQNKVLSSLNHIKGLKKTGCFLDLPCKNPYLIHEIFDMFGDKSNVYAFENGKNSTYSEVVNKKLFGDVFNYNTNYIKDNLTNTRGKVLSFVNADFCGSLHRNALYAILNLIMRNEWTDKAVLNVTYAKSRGEAGNYLRYDKYIADITREFARKGFDVEYTIFQYGNYSEKTRATAMMLYTFTITKK